MNIFYHLLANTTLASVTNFTVWFAITFYVYLETKSVLATGVIAGIYLVITAVSGFWFGSLVDHHKKKNVMITSSIFSLCAYLVSFYIYQFSQKDVFTSVDSAVLWIFVLTTMAGVMAGNIRNIAMPTLVTILFTGTQRAKANGMIGTVSGISFLLTSVISGFLVAAGGMFYVFILALAITLTALAHLAFINIKEDKIVHLEGKPAKVDIKGTYKLISKIPGLFPLILFTTFNNFLGGVFMALMDAYGLSLVSVELWGLLWGILSTGFIIGGALIAKYGLGKNPLKTMLIANVAIWTISTIFTVQSWILLLAAGMFIYLITIPFIEASEQTILQKVVPKERQGRVFGFAQSLEQSASPLTAFLIGPIAQFFFIPFMTTGYGANLIGNWYGTGADRGIALVFSVTGVIGLIMTITALNSKYYRQLTTKYLEK